MSAAKVACLAIMCACIACTACGSELCRVSTGTFCPELGRAPAFNRARSMNESNGSGKRPPIRPVDMQLANRPATADPSDWVRLSGQDERLLAW